MCYDFVFLVFNFDLTRNIIEKFCQKIAVYFKEKFWWPKQKEMTSNESNTSSSSSSSTSLFDKFFLMRKNKKNKSQTSDKQQTKIAVDNVIIEKKSSNNTNLLLTQNDININSNQLLPSFLKNKPNGGINLDQALVDKSNLNPTFDLGMII
jgi:hypothetical protein